MNLKNSDVTNFLLELNHPQINIIEGLRDIILSTDFKITENIKWNGPNYIFEENDRLTLKIHPPKKIQLIIHCGVKKREEATKRRIEVNSDKLIWITNDRGYLEFNKIEEVIQNKIEIINLINEWLKIEL